MAEKDPAYYRIYGLGQYGKLEGLVFPNFRDIEKVPEGAKLLGYGQDFGYTNDPSSCVGAYLYDGELILDEVFYRRGMQNRDIAQAYANE